MPVRDVNDDSRVAYRLPQPAEMTADLLVSPVLPADERIWVPQAPNVWFRPLCLSASQGYWVNLLKVTRAGVLRMLLSNMWPFLAISAVMSVRL